MVLAATHTVVFLAGVSLVLSPYVHDQRVAGFWNDLCAGAVLAVSGAAPLVEPRSVKGWRPAQLFAGLWLIAVPYVVGQETLAASTRIGDLLLGVIVLAAWVAGTAVVFLSRGKGGRLGVVR
ncbi:SPW repeat domain-containing protein [Amycolatopsis tolypomycina]|uniref:SPW repeat domain-containing protein n=1 Tax=Amycolatopsis tolypomycina TaxID=208445 RepID=UPI0033A57955